MHIVVIFLLFDRVLQGLPQISYVCAQGIRVGYARNANYLNERARGQKGSSAGSALSLSFFLSLSLSRLS